MFDNILNNTTNNMSVQGAIICLVASVVFGALIALCYAMTGKSKKNFLASLVILPAMVQTIIMIGNGNLGTSVAIVGAFSLIRFRSLPGTSREISSIFFSMVVGIATGMGYITYGAFITVVIGIIMILIYKLPLNGHEDNKKMLKITIYENIDYTSVFDDLFEKYLKSCEVESVKTTNMGSMYQLSYVIEMKDNSEEKNFIDEIRRRNGNLTVICGRGIINNEQL